MCSCHSLFSAQAWPYDWARVGANQTENGVTRIEKAGSERELLSLFLTRLHKLDPDIILGGWGGGGHGSVVDPDPFGFRIQELCGSGFTNVDIG